MSRRHSDVTGVGLTILTIHHSSALIKGSIPAIPDARNVPCCSAMRGLMTLAGLCLSINSLKHAPPSVTTGLSFHPATPFANQMKNRDKTRRGLKQAQPFKLPNPSDYALDRLCLDCFFIFVGFFCCDRLPFLQIFLLLRCFRVTVAGLVENKSGWQSQKLTLA